MAAIVCRLGPCPEDVELGARKGSIEKSAGKYIPEIARVVQNLAHARGEEPGWDILSAALRWDHRERATASSLAAMPWEAQAKLGEAESGEAKPAEQGEAEPGKGAAEKLVWDLGMSCANAEIEMASGECACAGHCYTPGHRYWKGCWSKVVVKNSLGKDGATVRSCEAFIAVPTAECGSSCACMCDFCEQRGHGWRCSCLAM